MIEQVAVFMLMAVMFFLGYSFCKIRVAKKVERQIKEIENKYKQLDGFIRQSISKGGGDEKDKT